MDFVWLSVGALGVISATFQARKFIAEGERNLTEQHLQAWWRIALEDARSKVHLYGEMYNYDEWKYNRDEIPRYKAAAVWFRDEFTALQAGYRSDAWKKFLREKGPLARDDPTWHEKTSAIDYLVIMDHDSTKLRALEEQLQPRNYEIIALVFGPWMLAVALAIRVTRVSADLRQE